MQKTNQTLPVTIRTLTLFDILLIIIVLTGAAFSIPYIQSSQPSTIAIYKDNTLIAEYPLNENKEIHIKGHEGPMTITLEDEHVFIKSSTCRKQICVKSGKIGKPSRQLVCAPNHILVEIRSNKKDEGKLDGIAQ